jgi:alpha-maltose-1-phosphate synthase
VFSFGEQREHQANITVRGIGTPAIIPSKDSHNDKLIDALLRDVIMTGTIRGVDIIHCHTWYTHLAGCLLKQLLHVPLILTTHSLEPHRPWKREQLGNAYDVSSWVEKTAYRNADGVIAVSKSMKHDVETLYGVEPEKVRIIYNGIDADQYRPTYDAELVASYGVDPGKPFILFVGRITRQKGIIHLVNAVKHIAPEVQVVLCAGAPDTEEIGRELSQAIARIREQGRKNLIWIPQVLSKHDLIRLYSHASLFVCPSVYEPFGIINLEAMACGTPVVASAVGGITEVVVEGETGLLVPFEPQGANAFEPKNPERFSRDLASAVNRLLASPEKLESMASKARERVEKHFGWKSIARQTLEFYEFLTVEFYGDLRRTA